MKIKTSFLKIKTVLRFWGAAFAATALLLATHTATAQQRTLTVTLTNLNGTPVAGATLLLNDANNTTTQTNSEGVATLIIEGYPVNAPVFTDNRPATFTREIITLNGQTVLRDRVTLPGNNSTPAQLKPNTLYLEKLTGDDNQSSTTKIVTNNRGELPGGTAQQLQAQLKSGSFGYRVTVRPDPQNKTFADTTLAVPGWEKEWTAYEAQLRVNEFPVNIAGTFSKRFNADTLKIALTELIKTDDKLTCSINFNGGNNTAFVTNDSLTVFGSAQFGLTATDTKGQKVTVPVNIEQYITVSGKTFDIISDTTRNATNDYYINSEFINRRTAANTGFTVFNKANTFVLAVTSDENGHYQFEVPAKGNYGVEITTAGKYPMMYMIIADSVVNNENIACIDTTLSRYNFAQEFCGFKPDKNDGTLRKFERNMRTISWDPAVKDSLEFLFLNVTYSLETFTIGEDTITAAMKKLVLDKRKEINPIFNNFFKEVEYVDDFSRFADNGVVGFFYSTGGSTGGGFGVGISNGMFVGATIRLDKGTWDNYANEGVKSILRLNLQENASVNGAYAEGWEDDPLKPSIWYSASCFEHFTEDSKKAQMFYNWISDKLTKEGTPAEGFYPSFFSSRIAREFKGNARVTRFISEYALPDVKQKFGVE